MGAAIILRGWDIATLFLATGLDLVTQSHQNYVVSRFKRTTDVPLALMVSHNSEVNHLNILVLVVAIVDDTLWKPNEAFG